MIGNKRGQSTIEFIIVFSFSIPVLLAFIHLAITFSSGYYTHYATFMAARTYMVYDNNNQDAAASYTGVPIQRAQQVFREYRVDRMGAYGASDLIITPPGAAGVDYEMVGASIDYAQSMNLLSFFGGGIDLDLKSEAYLGKEPTRGECLSRIEYVMTRLLENPGAQQRYVTNFDNGC